MKKIILFFLVITLSPFSSSCGENKAPYVVVGFLFISSITYGGYTAYNYLYNNPTINPGHNESPKQTLQIKDESHADLKNNILNRPPTNNQPEKLTQQNQFSNPIAKDLIKEPGKNFTTKINDKNKSDTRDIPPIDKPIENNRIYDIFEKYGNAID